MKISGHRTAQNSGKIEIVDIWISSVNKGALIMCYIWLCKVPAAKAKKEL